MSYNYPGNPSPPTFAPDRSGGGGWLKIVIYVLIGLALLAVIAVIGCYYALMHTSLPFKLVESMLASDTNSPFKLQGFSGTLSKGFAIESIRWGGVTGAGDIADVRVKYSGFGDLMSGERIIFKELHVGKAHFEVAGFDDFLSLSELHAPHSPGAPGGGAPGGSAGNSRLVQIERLSLLDLYLTNRVTKHSISIPKVEWTGFKSQRGAVELGQFTVSSEALKIATVPGRSADIGGRPVAFSKRFEGTVSPRLHPSLRQGFQFTIDAGYTNQHLFYLLSAFNGGLEGFVGPDGAGHLRCKDLDLSRYFSGLVPRALTLDATTSQDAASGVSRLQVRSGSFKLGLLDFTVAPMQLESSDAADSTNSLIAVSRSAGREFTYQLLPGHLWNVEQRLSVRPEMTLEDTLATVLAGKPFAELDPQQQAEVRSALPAFKKKERLVEPEESSTE